MRRFVFAFLIAAASPLFMGAGQPAPSGGLIISSEDRAELNRISEYLNGIATLKGTFLQIAPSGDVSEGTFYISKPGKMRFEYKPPSPNLIVSDGTTIAVANRRLNTVDRYPLQDTPLSLILSNTIDLLHNSAVLNVKRENGTFIIGARSSKNRSRANITLVFSEPDLELRQWTVIDDQGQSTTVSLRDITPGTPLAPTLFQLPDVNRFSHRRQQ